MEFAATWWIWLTILVVSVVMLYHVRKRRTQLMTKAILSENHEDITRLFTYGNTAVIVIAVVGGIAALLLFLAALTAFAHIGPIFFG